MRRQSAASLLLLLLTSCASGDEQPLDRFDDTAFWALVDRVAQEAGPSVADRAELLSRTLRGSEAPRLESWQQLLVARVEQVTSASVARAFSTGCGRELGPAEYGGWLVAQGEQVWDAVQQDPSGAAAVRPDAAACEGVGAAFASAAVAPYSDLGFVPGSDAFPLVPGS